MKLKILIVLLAVACDAVALQANKSMAVSNWSDSTRDVYIDNELDRAAQVLTAESPSRLAIISGKLETALVVNVPDHTVSSIPKDAFKLNAERTSATCESDAAMKVVGKFTRIDGPIYFFVAEGKPIVLRSHPGLTGEMSSDKLWETVPVWRSIMQAYTPNNTAVTQLKAANNETTVTLAFGTWCPDSKNYVPKLIKALDAAGNQKIHLKLVGIDNQFREPVTTVQPRRITNVPTVIVERGGREIGRIVETPAASTIEEDLASILNGKQPVHSGRWDRGPKLANGTYSYRDRTGKEIGTESWELFSTSEGGYLVHSLIITPDLTTDVFHRVDATRRPSFTEVTKFHGDDRTRTRFTIEKSTMTARMRGSASGVVSQTLEVPERLFLSSPSIAGQGFVQSQETENYQISSYLAPQEFDKAMGVLGTTSCQAKGEETVKVPAGEFGARHIVRKYDRDVSEWWVHSQLGIPVKGVAGQTEYVLTSVMIAGRK